MLIVLVGLYTFACLTSSRPATLAVGTALAILLHPTAALTALIVVFAAWAAPRTSLTARTYTAIALGLIVAKNSLAPDQASSLVGVSFVLFQGYYTIVNPPALVGAIPVRAAHLIFYPQLLCGPIIPPKAYYHAPAHRVSGRKVQYAHCLFASGMMLKIWCSDILSAVTAGPETGLFHGLLLLFQIYADFAGWCLMGSAIGLACGIAIPRNFRFPFRRTTAVAAWSSWNTSLNQWVRAALPLRTVAPYLGRFGGVIVYCAILALWHGLFANFFLYMAANLFFFWWQAQLKSPILLRLSTSLLFLVIGFTFFSRAPNTWLGLDTDVLDQIALAGGVLVLFEAGLIYRVFRHREMLHRLWWLMPTVIVFLFAFRPAAKAFMYTRF